MRPKVTARWPMKVAPSGGKQVHDKCVRSKGDMSVVYVGAVEIKEKQIIRIVTEDGEYEGKVETADDEDEIITLINVKDITSGKTFISCQRFHESEILKVDVIKSAPIKQEKDTKTHTTWFNTSQKNPNENEDEFEINNPASSTKTPCQNVYIVIDSLGDTFENAIKTISKSYTIGLAAEGINLSRYGTLCWLSIEAQYVVYLFDMLTFGYDFMNRGLRQLMESYRYLKVIHDCRFLSDALSTFYRTQLLNVFDTQAAQVVLYTRKNRAFPNFVRPLSDSLIDIGVDKSQFAYSPVLIREGSEEEDQACWAQRPIPKEILHVAINNVKYLRKLRTALIKDLNSDLTNACEHYLNCHREATDDELKEFECHLLPKDFHRAVNIEPNQPDEEENNDPGYDYNSIRSYNRRLWYTRDACHLEKYSETPYQSSRPSYFPHRGVLRFTQPTVYGRGQVDKNSKYPQPSSFNDTEEFESVPNATPCNKIREITNQFFFCQKLQQSVMYQDIQVQETGGSRMVKISRERDQYKENEDE